MNHIELIRKKIVTLKQLEPLLHIWHLQSQKIIFTNGCFDIIHAGHIHTLAACADLGGKLIVALNTDASVRRIKKSNRPLQDENTRALVMASFSFTDAVILFDEDTPLECIKAIQPDILVKGGDYKKEEVVGYKEMQQWNGVVEIIPFIEGFSTTSIEEKIKKG